VPGGETRSAPSRQCPAAKPAARRRGSARRRNPQRAPGARAAAISHSDILPLLYAQLSNPVGVSKRLIYESVINEQGQGSYTLNDVTVTATQLQASGS
jgi:hypothetical protein